MVYITGDTHGIFKRIEKFCMRIQPTREDVLIILGDAGFNFFGGMRDRVKKELVSRLPITVFSIHGNHEKRPASMDSYTVREWRGGKVYVEEEFPNLLFAMDGEVYDFEGTKAMAIGGAYSVDKEYRIRLDWPWFPDEQPSEAIKQRVEAKLDALGWKIDVVLSHTTPYKYRPVELFTGEIDESTVDQSTEIWLGRLEDKLDYKRWYCGHFHINKNVDRLILLFEDIREFNAE